MNTPSFEQGDFSPPAAGGEQALRAAIQAAQSFNYFESKVEALASSLEAHKAIALRFIKFERDAALNRIIAAKNRALRTLGASADSPDISRGPIDSPLDRPALTPNE